MGVGGAHLLLDERRDVLLDVVLLESLGGAVDGILLHVLCGRKPQRQSHSALLLFASPAHMSTCACAHSVDSPRAVRTTFMCLVWHARERIFLGVDGAALALAVRQPPCKIDPSRLPVPGASRFIGEGMVGHWYT